MRNKPFDHQIAIIKSMTDSLLNPQKVPLIVNAAPNSGKTYMTGAAIENYVKVFPRAKILVLTYAQKVLRTQFVNMCEKEQVQFNYRLVERGKELKTAYNSMEGGVIITLPQTITRHNLPKFDLVIVDEAHHFYFAPIVRDILKRTQPTRQLLLTGTPYPFVDKNQLIPGSYEFVSSDLLDLIKQNRIAKNLSIEIIESDENISTEDYNEDGELHSNFRFSRKDIINNLNQALQFINLKKKTLVACHNVEQARIINKEFVRRGINSLLSTSNIDPKSININEFINNSAIKVLCVVYRGILGFDLPEMCNGLDFTASQNPSRIYQLFCRNVRLHPRDLETPKVFIKMVPTAMKNWFIIVMEGALHLGSKKYSLLFNGKNFMGFPTLIRSSSDKIKNESKKKLKSGNVKPNYKLFDGLSLLGFFNTISSHSRNSSSTIGKIREKLLGIKNIDPEGRERLYWEWCYSHWFTKFDGSKVNYLPNSISKDFEERRHGRWAMSTGHYININSNFRKRVRDSNLQSMQVTILIDKAEQCLAYHSLNGRPPSQVSGDSKTKMLGIFLSRCRQKKVKYLPDALKKKLEALPKVINSSVESAKQILKYWKIHKTPPSKDDPDPKISNLAQVLGKFRRGQGKVKLPGNLEKKILSIPTRYELKRSENGTLPGVFKTGSGKSFTASLYIDRKRMHLGTFKTIEEANNAIEKGKLK